MQSDNLDCSSFYTCIFFYVYICYPGKSKFGLDPKRQYIYFKRDQSGTSMQNIRHWVQIENIASN